MEIQQVNMPINIFISYRRSDSAPYAGRIYDRLKQEFGAENVFIDIDSIAIGQDFVSLLQRKLESCHALILIIGKTWLTSKDEFGNRRLDNPEDFVRIEVTTAIKRNIHLIPTLVGNSVVMPNVNDLPEELAAVCRYQALEISDRRFHNDTDILIENLKTLPQKVRSRKNDNIDQFARNIKRTANQIISKKFPEFNLRYSKYANPLSETGVLCVLFCPDGKSFISADTQGLIKVWDVFSGKEKMVLQKHKAPIYIARFNENGETLISAGMDKKIILWDFLTGKVRHSFEAHEKTILSLAFNPIKNLLFSSGYDGKIFVWDLNINKLLCYWDSEQKVVYSLTFLINNNLLLSAGHDGTFKYWNIPEGNLNRVIDAHNCSIYCSCLSIKKNLMASGDRDGIIKLWDIVSWEMIQSFTKYPDPIMTICFNSDATLLAAGGVDNNVLVWNVKDQFVKSIEYRETSVQSLSFSPDFRFLLSGWADGKMILWHHIKKSFTPRFL